MYRSHVPQFHISSKIIKPKIISIRIVGGSVDELVSTFGSFEKLSRFFHQEEPECIFVCYTKHADTNNYIPSGRILTFEWKHNGSRTVPAIISIKSSKYGKKQFYHILQPKEIFDLTDSVDMILQKSNSDECITQPETKKFVPASIKFSIPLFPEPIIRMPIALQDEFPPL